MEASHNYHRHTKLFKKATHTLLMEVQVAPKRQSSPTLNWQTWIPEYFKKLSYLSLSHTHMHAHTETFATKGAGIAQSI